jgi:secreted trypsin-like serine protease
MLVRLACIGFLSMLSSVAVASSSSESTPPTTFGEHASPVIGGSTVPEGKWRDVVLVVSADSTCTGTLIAPDIVLTAGHCVASEPYEVITDTVDYMDGGDHIPVKWSRAYPDWENKFDVGVLMLDHVARGKPRMIAPACAAKSGLRDGAMVHLVGFGMSNERSSTNNTALREVDLPVVDASCTSDEGCQSSVAPHGEFMAGGNGQGSCFGDSGGPVFLETADGPALVGIVSRGLAKIGTDCSDAGIYVRADKVVSWLQSVTGVDFDPSTCDMPADDPGEATSESGCSAGGAGGLGVGLALLGIVRRRRCASRKS